MKNKTRNIIPVLLATVALAGATLSARADDMVNNPTMSAGASDEPLWQFGLMVPLWAPEVVGNSTIRGRQENVDVSFNQLKDHLDASFSLGLMAHRGKFGLYGDVGYMKFSAYNPGPLGTKISGGLKFLVADAGVSYVLVQACEKHPLIIEGTAGVRYWYTETSLLLQDGAGTILFNGSKTYDLADPVVGLRGSQYFTPKFHLDMAGDIGGFDISHDTDWTWSASGMLTYDFCKHFSLSAGYKALALDESNGSGADKNGLNLIFNGAMVVATFKF